MVFYMNALAEYLLFLAICLLWPSNLWAQDSQVCEKVTVHNESLSVRDTNDLIQQQEAWVKWLDENRGTKGLFKMMPPRPDLSGMNLRNADMSGRDLRGVDLRCSDLRLANLTDAKLGPIWGPFNLEEGTTFWTSDLAGSDLRGANLTRADLNGVHFARARIGVTGGLPALYYLPGFGSGYVLDKDAECQEDESKTDFAPRWTKLENVSLTDADFTEAYFDPDLRSLPDVTALASGKNLYTLKYCRVPAALVVLRESFKKMGFRQQARELTYAIHHEDILREGKIPYYFSYILFELSCNWGMNPERPLLILIFTIILFTPFYARALYPSSKGRLWIVYPADRVERVGEAVPPERLTLGPTSDEELDVQLVRAMRLWVVAFSFSVTSAFAIGWHDLNFGTWIAQMWTREYRIRPTGWVRTVSGIQSLVSVYLLALWILTYFGQPFDY
jgi:uncharacterized protein YjbI with pentapeptide repeats